MTTSSLPNRRFSETERNEWRKRIIEIHDKMREKFRDGLYEVAFGDLSLTVLPDVYDPTAFTDTLWFAQQVKEIVGKKSLLEIGAGSGAISVTCALNGAIVVATDINPAAVKNIKITTKKYNLYISVKE